MDRLIADMRGAVNRAGQEFVERNQMAGLTRRYGGASDKFYLLQEIIIDFVFRNVIVSFSGHLFDQDEFYYEVYLDIDPETLRPAGHGTIQLTSSTTAKTLTIGQMYEIIDKNRSRFAIEQRY
jgi:hypothetical protein